MILQEDPSVDIDTPTGRMRTYIYRPVAPGRYPGLVFFSEIFQRTGPIKRTAALLAGHGFVVAVPEIFHEMESPGCEIAYDAAGADRGNTDKVGKTIEAYDSDARATIQFLRALPACNGKIGSIGICIGGHLSFRASMNPDVLAGVCFYATDIHKGSLGKGGDNTLARIGELKAEMLMIWGRQDPHVPTEGRAMIQKAMNDASVNFTWHEFNGAHAFLRDEGPRYDPALALTAYRLAIDLFKRKLGEGDRVE
ncbi:MAG: dienelactone hydrolase family protein [Vicinamibacteria bacterium]